MCYGVYRESTKHANNEQISLGVEMIYQLTPSLVAL